MLMSGGIESAVLLSYYMHWDHAGVMYPLYVNQACDACPCSMPLKVSTSLTHRRLVKVRLILALWVSRLPVHFYLAVSSSVYRHGVVFSLTNLGLGSKRI